MDKLIVACNKVDTLKDDPQKLEKQVNTLKAHIGKTKFGPTTKVVPVSAMLASEPGGLGESRLEELVTTIMEIGVALRIFLETAQTLTTPTAFQQ